MIIRMIKMLIVLVLIILVVGMYYRYDLTKEAMTITGHAVAKLGKEAIETARESDLVQNVTEKIKEKVTEKIKSREEGEQP